MGACAIYIATLVKAKFQLFQKGCGSTYVTGSTPKLSDPVYRSIKCSITVFSTDRLTDCVDIVPCRGKAAYNNIVYGSKLLPISIINSKI